MKKMAETVQYYYESEEEYINHRTKMMNDGWGISSANIGILKTGELENDKWKYRACYWKQVEGLYF